MVGQVSLLGQYQFQLTDAHGHVVHGMTLRQPFTIRYHYITAMLASLGTEQAAESFSYDGDLRPSEDTAIWGNGSGQSGQFFDETRSYD